MALTLVEAAKLHQANGEDKRAAVIEIFARESDLLRAMPWVQIQGNSFAYNVENALPGIAFRGINASYSESTGVVNPQSEPLKIAGGDLDVDVALVKTMGAQTRGYHEAAKARALAREIGYQLIEGSTATDPASFEGLKRRIPIPAAGSGATAGQYVLNGTAAGAATALSCANLDLAIDLVDNPTHIIMGKGVRRALTVYLRGVGSLQMSRDEFGRQLTMYNDLPILIADNNGDRAALGLTETSMSGGANTATSVFVVSLGVDKYHGIQNGTMEVRDLGELQSQPVYRTRVEWLVGQCIVHPRAASRIYNVSHATATA